MLDFGPVVTIKYQASTASILITVKWARSVFFFFFHLLKFVKTEPSDTVGRIFYVFCRMRFSAPCICFPSLRCCSDIPCH